MRKHAALVPHRPDVQVSVTLSHRFGAPSLCRNACTPTGASRGVGGWSRQVPTGGSAMPAAKRRATTRRVKRVLNCKPSPQLQDDWTFEHAAGADIVAAAPTIPSSKDMRATWWKIN